MEICVLSIGKISSEWIAKGVKLFESRITRYTKFTSMVLSDVKTSKSLPKDQIKEEEGKMFLQNISPSDYVALLDEKGKEFTSREFSDWIQKQMSSGKKRLVLVIGGPFGFSSQMYDRANFKISLSKMTFTHEMAKLLTSEQIYRALTILKGEPYHHD